MTTVDGLVKKLERAGAGLEAATRSGVNVAAAVMASAVDASIAADTGGSMKLRGMHGAKPVRARANPAASMTLPTALVNTNSPGVMAILERGAKSHVVGSGQKGAQGVAHNVHGVLHAVTKSGGKSYTAKLMQIGNDVVWGPFVAGGSPPKHTFSNAVNATAPAVPRIVQAETSKAIRAAWR